MAAVGEGVLRGKRAEPVPLPQIRAARGAEQMPRMIRASGTFPITIRLACEPAPSRRSNCEGELMNGLIYLVGLIVVIMAILSLFGLR
jgi:hypothetical protein